MISFCVPDCPNSDEHGCIINPPRPPDLNPPVNPKGPQSPPEWWDNEDIDIDDDEE